MRQLQASRPARTSLLLAPPVRCRVRGLRGVTPHLRMLLGARECNSLLTNLSARKHGCRRQLSALRLCTQPTPSGLRLRPTDGGGAGPMHSRRGRRAAALTGEQPPRPAAARAEAAADVGEVANRGLLGALSPTCAACDQSHTHSAATAAMTRRQHEG